MYYKYVIPNNAPLITTNTHISSFSKSELTAKEPSLMHSHTSAEIIIPLNNNGLLLCNNETINMSRQNIYIIPPNISHTETNIAQDKHFNYFVFTIDDHSFKYDLSTTCYIKLDGSTIFEEIYHYLQNAYNHLATRKKHNELIALLNLSCCYRVFIEFIEQTPIIILAQKNKQKTTLIQEIEHFLTNNFYQDIKISDIAKQYGISERLLNLKFKKDLGISPKQYLINIRINTAKEQLLNTDQTISQIANTCGFASPAYFTAYLKKATGKTPKEFRSKC